MLSPVMERSRNKYGKMGCCIFERDSRIHHIMGAFSKHAQGVFCFSLLPRGQYLLFSFFSTFFYITFGDDIHVELLGGRGVVGASSVAYDFFYMAQREDDGGINGRTCISKQQDENIRRKRKQHSCYILHRLAFLSSLQKCLIFISIISRLSLLPSSVPTFGVI